MTRIQLACCCLLASAFLLTGLLLVQVAQTSPNTARADMIVDKGNFVMMTAQTKNEEESLFLLDNTTGTLYIYNLDVARRNIDLAQPVSLRGNAAGGAGGAGGAVGGGAGGGGRGGPR